MHPKESTSMPNPASSSAQDFGREFEQGFDASARESASSTGQAPVILLRLPNWLGDGVMSTPSLELLFSRFPNARIYLVAPRGVLELFASDMRIAGCFVDETKGAKGIFGRVRATWRLGRHIAAQIECAESRGAESRHKIDIAIMLTNHIFSALLLYASGARMRIGYTKGAGKLLAAALLTHPLPRVKGMHQVESYANLLRPALAALESRSLDFGAIPSLRLCTKPLESSSLDSGVLDSSKLPRIGLNPGAAYGSAKCWEPHYFATLAASLARAGKQVVIYGVASDRELAEQIITQARALYEQAGGAGGENAENMENLAAHFDNACGRTSIQSLIGEISTLQAFITNDSGSMHIAAALGVPTIALFGPTSSRETAPWKAPHARILSANAPCAPCKKRTCPIPPNNPAHHRCMRDLTPNLVQEALAELLAEAPESNAQDCT